MAHRLLTVTLAVAVAAATTLSAEDVQNPLTDSATWEDLRVDVIGETPILDGAAPLTVEAPYRAHDAAVVPVVLRQTDPSVAITRATVVIDENPAPVAGEFTFGPAMAPLEFEMRVRVDQYSNIRVLTETEDGLYMTGRFVKASGGCSAPATRDPEAALAGMGDMRLRMFDAAETLPQSKARLEAQIMVRHPNYSGLQRDQITQLFIPAHFIDTLEVRQGDDLLFSMAGGISISENPVFRFSYDNNGAESLSVTATDTDGNTFERVLPVAPET